MKTNASDRANKALLHTQLVHLLTNCDDDTMYYKRLTWALEFISNTLSSYSDLVEHGVQQRDSTDEDGN